MVDQIALVRAFSEYADALLRNYQIGPVLYRLTDQVVDVLGVDGAGVSIAQDDGSLRFVTATDATITIVEAQQTEAEEGPCQDAFRHGQRVVVADLVEEGPYRWPRYTEVAVAQGVRAVMGTPMPVGDRRIGALNVYQRQSGAWQPDTVDVAQLLADMASGYIFNAQIQQRTTTLAAQLQHALDSRVIVEQAKGVLAERHDISPDEAFDRLRARARSERARVHDVAEDVVAGDLTL